MVRCKGMVKQLERGKDTAEREETIEEKEARHAEAGAPLPLFSALMEGFMK